jgi:exodeoxyribonuclease VII small subunit
VKTKPHKTDQRPDIDSADQTPDFEQSLSELEALVQKLEQGDVPLEEALKTFERGVALTRQCQTALRTAQQKVEVLLAPSGSRNDDGEGIVAPFDDEDDADDAGR